MVPVYGSVECRSRSPILGRVHSLTASYNERFIFASNQISIVRCFLYHLVQCNLVHFINFLFCFFGLWLAALWNYRW
jgi:hypothetical protein